MHLDMLATPEVHCQIVRERLVVKEVLLDHRALVTEAEHEITIAMMGVDLHDVPQDRVGPYVDQRLRPELRLLAHAGAQPAAKDHDLHHFSGAATWALVSLNCTASPRSSGIARAAEWCITQSTTYFGRRFTSWKICPK